MKQEMKAGTSRLIALAALVAVTAGSYIAVMAGGNAQDAGAPAAGWSTISGSSSPPGAGVPRQAGTGAAPLERGAMAHFRAGLAHRPDDPTALIQLADRVSRSDRRAGERAFVLLARAYPSRASVWTAAAADHYRTGNRDRAAAALERALRLDPRHAGARLLRGRLLADGDPPDIAAALTEWRLVIETAPGTPEAREAALLLRLHEGR